ncbi:MAG TPA: hypothetical protein PKX92_07065 [Edaphocola sp.]|nr:hypothetical protein [Edaphocola sp.]
MMENNSLYNDLIKDWHIQKEMVKEQVKIIDPIATSLRKSMATRFLNVTFNVLMEIFMYILAIGSVAYIFFMDNLGPFFVMSKAAVDPILFNVGKTDMKNFQWTIIAMFILLAFLFFVIGRMLSNIRRKNSVISQVGKDMKVISGQLLERKSVIENLEQRHVMTLPNTDVEIDGVQLLGDDENKGDTLL